MLTPEERALLDGHLQLIEGLTRTLQHVVDQQHELVRRLVALEARRETPPDAQGNRALGAGGCGCGGRGCKAWECPYL